MAQDFTRYAVEATNSATTVFTATGANQTFDIKGGQIRKSKPASQSTVSSTACRCLIRLV